MNHNYSTFQVACWFQPPKHVSHLGSSAQTKRKQTRHLRPEFSWANSSAGRAPCSWGQIRISLLWLSKVRLYESVWIGRLVCVRFPHYHVQCIRFGLTIMLHFHSFSTSLVEHSLALHFISETRNGQRLLQSAWNV